MGSGSTDNSLKVFRRNIMARIWNCFPRALDMELGRTNIMPMISMMSTRRNARLMAM